MKTAKNNPAQAAALKAERERDKVLAMREYEAAKAAQQANMERLRSLRLARERADAQAAKARMPAKKKVASKAAS